MSGKTRHLWMTYLAALQNERIWHKFLTAYAPFTLSSQNYFLQQHTAIKMDESSVGVPLLSEVTCATFPPFSLEQTTKRQGDALEALFSASYKVQHSVNKKSRTLSTSAIHPSFPSHTTPLCQPSRTLTMPRRDTVTVPMSGAW